MGTETGIRGRGCTGTHTGTGVQRASLAPIGSGHEQEQERRTGNVNHFGIQYYYSTTQTES
jgi:hypothetical protein